MRCLLAATCLTPVALGVSVTPLFAETVISTALTNPVATGTANDDIRNQLDRIGQAGRRRGGDHQQQ